MQEGHGSGDQPPDQPGNWFPFPAEGAEPEADDASPGTSWVPPSTPSPSGDPGHTQPIQPGYGQPGYGQDAQAGPGYGPPGHEAHAGARSGGPGQGEREDPPSAAATELGTWTMSASGQGAWEPPPGGSGSWGPPPPGGGYGQPGGAGPPGGYGQPGGPPRRRRGNHPLVYVLVALVAAALGAGTVFALQSESQPADSNSGSSLPPQQIPSPGSSQNNGNTNTSGIDVQAVKAKVEPGVVDITSSLRYSGQVFEGTGMVLTSSGLVLTNNHVVDGSTGLTATIVTSGRRYNAQIVGTDATEDIALLRLVGVSGLRTVNVGDSSKVTVGTQVVAMGNAGGQGGTPTVTSGSITAVGRTITASDAGSDSSETLHNMLQTNAPIAEGDSGGPLSNAAGQVIGMDTAANTQSFGGSGTSEGFAIPINRALAIVRQMAAGHGSATIHIGEPAFMGIAVASTSSSAVSLAESPQQQLQQLQQAATGQPGSGFSSPVNSNGRCLNTGSGSPVPSPIAPASSGTLIAGAFCNAPADAAGLTGGDVILAINGRTVGAPSTLTNVLAQFRPGDRVSVSWMDTSGQRHTSFLKLISGPAK
jgi:S1-C subfamily serine protease